MMASIMNIVFFLTGMCISVQLTGAFFSIIDLWYAVRTRYGEIIWRILTWMFITTGVALFIGPEYRPSFLWGVGFYPMFLTGAFLIAKRLASRPEPPPDQRV